ncbi:MAG: gliding motility lipoprotein GldD [Bacteroidales bacterium]
MNKQYRFLNYQVFLLLLLIFCVVSCDTAYSPKPMGYFRIDLPERQYRTFDSTYPYSFSYPVYSKIIPKTDSLSEPYWMNITFPQFKGTLYISYKPVNKNLPTYLEDARNMVMKHIPKANSIEEKIIHFPDSKVYGIFYDIRGNSAASPFQFFITDSTRHFLRGSLYFYTSPNNDSLEPVIEFLKKDIENLVKTVKWKP